MLSKDEVWEVMRCAISLPLSKEQLDWLMEKRERAELLEEFVTGRVEPSDALRD